jgi:hypothetical protein
MPTPLQWLAALAGKADMEASWRLPVQTEATKKPFHIPKSFQLTAELNSLMRILDAR